MKSIGTDVCVLETGKFSSVACKKTSGHAAFDAKIYFSPKFTWVLDRHVNPSPADSAHA